MTEIEKFRADLQRSLKHYRAENSGRYNGEQASKEVVKVFLRATQVPGQLPSSCTEYWTRTYIEPSSDLKNEPTEENLDRLCAIFAFLEGSDDFEEALSHDDWHMLGELVNYEAEDLPLDILQTLMGKIVFKGAL